jgi:hypothetical protein
VTIQDLGSVGELVAAIATIATLAYLAVQIRHNTRHVRAQMGHDGWLSTADDIIAVMGGDAAEALARAELGGESLSDSDIEIVDAYFRTFLQHMARVEHTNSLDLHIYSNEETAHAFVHHFNSVAGKAWWESNSAHIELMAPAIGACVDGLLKSPGCPSKAESLSEFRRLLKEG